MARAALRWSWFPRIHFVGAALVLGGTLWTAACGGGGGGTTALDEVVPGPGGDPVVTAPAPVVESAASAVADRDGLVPLRLLGRGFATPARIEVLREDGSVLRSVEAAVLDGGTAVEALGVRVPGPGREAVRRVRVRNAGGRTSAETIEVTFRRVYRPVGEDAGRAFLRLAPAAYGDGVASLAGAERPGAREVSNGVLAQEESVPNARGASDLVWQWGQFLDHDLDLTVAAVPEERADVPVPAGDPFFDPLGTGAMLLPFTRSAYVADAVPREQVNGITPRIDASMVYGSDDVRARALRANDGTGRLLVSDGDLLPFNTMGLPNAGGPSPDLQVAGDIRANETIGLVAMHVLFVREHNRVADDLRARHPELTEDEVYEEARRWVGAEVQAITYRDFFGWLLGPAGPGPYAGYDPDADPGISNEFATAAYRFGHSLLPATLLRLDAAGNEIPEGHLALRDAFFSGFRLATEGGIEPVLRGLQAQRSEELDARVIDDVRSFLFGPPGAGGLDLAALNVQRGRDHGLASYNDTRAAFGLPRRATFEDVTRDPETQRRLLETYGEVDAIDLWVGCLSEDHLPGAMVGETLRAVLVDQFRRTRDGDPYWYERVYDGEELDQLRATRLGDVIRRNTTIRGELPPDVFGAPGSRPLPRPPPAGPMDPLRRQRMLDAVR
jgi:hypothetical protein